MIRDDVPSIPMMAIGENARDQGTAPLPRKPSASVELSAANHPTRRGIILSLGLPSTLTQVDAATFSLAHSSAT
jgi:hypothetical protein